MAAERAAQVLAESDLINIWSRSGAEVRIVGSLKMGLMAKHRDIDLHVYSENITEEKSFAIGAQMAKNPKVIEIKCINGLGTDEHCIAWHFFYRHEGRIWQIDVIHIEEGTEYDGFFERMADRIVELMTPEQKDTILRLKAETPDGEDIHGVEYYEAVIADGIQTLPELREWVKKKRKCPPTYWNP